MKQFSIFLISVLAFVGTAMVMADTPYYTYGSGTYGTETSEQDASTPPTPAYRMPSTPIEAVASSADTLSLPIVVGSYVPAFAIVYADDNFYLNGTVATPTLGFFYAKETNHLIPLGESVSIVTSTDTVNLKILPVK